MAKEYRLNIRIGKNLHDFLQQKEKGETTKFVEESLDFTSSVNWEKIKTLAKEHLVRPEALVDAAVLYFSKLKPGDQKHKLADYFEEWENRLRKQKENEDNG